MTAKMLDKLRRLPLAELPGMAEELRSTIIDSVSRNGGHLASSCGCVELIMALHRVFDTPAEKIFFDVGHQAYAHKLLTGREEGFKKLRRYDGISGFTTPLESGFDPAVSGHAGTALSAALGHCAADPDAPEKVIAVIGDGSMGCGVTLEALNHAATLKGSKRLIVILNDNRMSISGNVGALSKALNRVMAAKSYNKFRSRVIKMLSPLPKLKNFVARLNEAGKSMFLPPALLFETLGLRYFGAVDGNDLQQLIPTLERLRKIDDPVLLHVITQKGYGCEFAQADPTKYHGISGCDPDTGEMAVNNGGFSEAFAAAMVDLAEKDPELQAVCPAMLEGTGLRKFAEKFPDRCFDVGIAEEHALTFAAGLAAAGKHPVCAFYDTFLQRALDAVYHDIALAKVPVVIAVDRAGVVADGPTHHGIYNCAFLRAIPNLTVINLAAECEMAEALEFAVKSRLPVVLRYPKGGGAAIPGLVPFEYGKAVIRKSGKSGEPVLWASGKEVATALEVAGNLEKYGCCCTVADARFLKPFDRETALKFADSQQFVIEDHCETGGIYSALSEIFSAVPHAGIYSFAWSAEKVISHGEIGKLKAAAGLDAASITEKIAGLMQKKPI
ncbi:MAG: 1-deoxy-D-xylulose-5-phosphate synthase [Lentisphaerae bacterium]|nr:1-deoxy-D-xylulose-5-phosphate synthase [Lentisphaerota bacterium]